MVTIASREVYLRNRMGSRTALVHYLSEVFEGVIYECVMAGVMLGLIIFSDVSDLLN